MWSGFFVLLLPGRSPWSSPASCIFPVHVKIGSPNDLPGLPPPVSYTHPGRKGKSPKEPNDTLQSFPGTLFPGEGEEHFIAPDADGDVLATDAPKDCPGKALKNPVLDSVFLFVVHFPEAVDVDHGESDGFASALCPPHLSGKPLLEEAPVGVEVREMVLDERALQAPYNVSYPKEEKRVQGRCRW